MQQIGIVTDHHFLRGKGSFYYPLEKWGKKFSENGYGFNFFSSHDDKKLVEQDVIIVDSRYLRSEIVHKKNFPDKSFIKEVFHKLKAKGIKIVLFDNKDGTGSDQFDLIKYVDVFVKKQVLKDREQYLKNKGGYSFRPFAEKYDLSEKAHLNYLSFHDSYTPCPAEHLHKIKVGWNIGMSDYRFFPFDRFYSTSLKNWFNFIYKEPNFNRDYAEKSIDTTFRGKVSNKKEVYSFQRNKVIELLKKSSNENFVTGPPISKRKYLSELKLSKTCISPYGYGEICYRDFEAIISGCVIIKPDMSHLETYPDIYKKNETYVPVEIDMSDLESTLRKVLENYNDYIPIIEKVQKDFLHAIHGFDAFQSHFEKIIEYEE